MERLTHMRCVASRRDPPTVTQDEFTQLMPSVADRELLSVDGIARLDRTFSFDDLAGALRSTLAMGELAGSEGHHPALLTEWGRTTASWWMRKSRGLHVSDFIMAARIDRILGSTLEGVGH